VTRRERSNTVFISNPRFINNPGFINILP
jgi:hypothetical protein